MKSHTFDLKNGSKVILNETDMMNICSYYEIQHTADYLRDNHEDWSEEKVQEVATETRRQMDKYGFEEDYAIKEAIIDLYGGED